MEGRCDKCGKQVIDLLVTAYGDKRCDHCWDDYLMTDRGKVEYFIGIVRGFYPMDEFDADFLGHVSVCWKEHRAELNMTIAEVQTLEAKAKAIGLL